MPPLGHSLRPAPAHTRRSDDALAAWVVVAASTLLVAVLGGFIAGGETDAWYRALAKAPGTPPGAVFGVVWTGLYVLMAVGAGLTWSAAGGWREADHAFGIYFVQLIANLGWTVLFFQLHAPFAALTDLLALLVLVVLMRSAFARHSLLAARLQIPYLLWLAFAAYLNAYVVFANPTFATG